MEKAAAWWHQEPANNFMTLLSLFRQPHLGAVRAACVCAAPSRQCLLQLPAAAVWPGLQPVPSPAAACWLPQRCSLSGPHTTGAVPGSKMEHKQASSRCIRGAWSTAAPLTCPRQYPQVRRQSRRLAARTHLHVLCPPLASQLLQHLHHHRPSTALEVARLQHHCVCVLRAYSAGWHERTGG